VKQLYEWCVATGPRDRPTVSPVGLTDAEPRACARMVEALEAVPAGTPARGWVTAMLYLPVLGSYDRYELRLSAERAGNGTVRLMPGGHD
jgi:hypothetical protein